MHRTQPRKAAAGNRQNSALPLGEVDVLAEVRLFGYGVQDVVGHVLGVGCGEAHAHVGHALRHLVHQQSLLKMLMLRKCGSHIIVHHL